ncbi:hypothetical protein FRC14_001301, partial [Serendipita sp. 396]
MYASISEVDQEAESPKAGAKRKCKEGNTTQEPETPTKNLKLDQLAVFTPPHPDRVRMFVMDDN